MEPPLRGRHLHFEYPFLQLRPAPPIRPRSPGIRVNSVVRLIQSFGAGIQTRPVRKYTEIYCKPNTHVAFCILFHCHAFVDFWLTIDSTARDPQGSMRADGSILTPFHAGLEWSSQGARQRYHMNLTNVAVSAFTFSTSLCRCCQASSGVNCSSEAKRST